MKDRSAPTAAGQDSEDRSHKLYDLGNTAVFASRADPRFSYCLYVPRDLGKSSECDLVVVMHGTGRLFQDYRRGFSEFARWNHCLVLCPLFPVGVLGDSNRDGFKYLKESDIRYDLALIDIIDEIGVKYGIDIEKFALCGYSGGGHFAHRFFMLHPQRLWAVSIGAPGSVTLLDTDQDWWVGVHNVPDLFGIELDFEAMTRVPVHMVVGAADVETWEITHREGSKHWMPGANEAGRTRPERLNSLRQSFEAKGIKVRFDLLPNVAHDGRRANRSIQDFFADVLSHRREHRNLDSRSNP